MTARHMQAIGIALLAAIGIAWSRGERNMQELCRMYHGGGGGIVRALMLRFVATGPSVKERQNPVLNFQDCLGVAGKELVSCSSRYS